MQFVLFLSQYIVPFLIFTIVVSGILERVQVYETFIKGAKDGFYTVLKIMPTLVGLMVAVGVLRAPQVFWSFCPEFWDSGRRKSDSRRAGTSFCRQNVFLVGGYRTFDGYLQGIRDRLLHREDRLHLHGVYGDDFLYDVCVFYDCKGEKDKIYTGRSDDCDGGRTCGECMACRKNVNNLLKNKFRDRFFL